MDEHPGQPPAPQPPPPTYPPADTTPTPGPAPYAQQGQPAYQQAAPRKKTWIWVVLGVVVLGLLGCCAAAALGGLALFSSAGQPADSIEAINQAALDGDQAEFEKYFDAESVTREAYSDFLDYIKGTEDYQSLVAELGEEEADRLLREEILPEDEFVTQLSSEFSIEALSPGDVPFPGYTVQSSEVQGSEAELSVVVVEEGEERTYVLGFAQEPYGDEDVWRLKEIKNIADLFE